MVWRGTARHFSEAGRGWSAVLRQGVLVWGPGRAVRAIGGPGGLLVFNFGCFALLLTAGYFWLRQGSRHAAALVFSLFFLAASIAPLYAFWLTSDALNFALVFLAFACAVAPPGEPIRPLRWRALGFVLLAASIFSKPLNLPLALPLAMGASRGGPAPTARALAAISVVVAIFFALNAAITGELNYQGGDRKTFYGAFPYDDRGTTFDSAGISLVTNSLTPVGAEGRFASVAANVGYFVVGRHFGLLPFGWPWLVVVGWWAAGERRKMWWQWALLAATAAAGAGDDRVDAVHVVWRRRTCGEPVLPERRGRVIFSGPAGEVVRSGCSRCPGPAVCVAGTLQPIYRRQTAVAGYAWRNLRGAAARADGCIGLSGHPRSAAEPNSARTRRPGCLLHCSTTGAAWVSAAGLRCGRA